MPWKLEGQCNKRRTSPGRNPVLCSYSGPSAGGFRWLTVILDLWMNGCRHHVSLSWKLQKNTQDHEAWCCWAQLLVCAIDYVYVYDCTNWMWTYESKKTCSIVHWLWVMTSNVDTSSFLHGPVGWAHHRLAWLTYMKRGFEFSHTFTFWRRYRWSLFCKPSLQSKRLP
jgi:hypothetical protein